MLMIQRRFNPYCFLIVLLGIALSYGANSSAESSVPIQITREGATSVPSDLLAMSYRITTDTLPLIEMALKGTRMRISELGQIRAIDKENATAWVDGYRSRQAIYAEVIESRGQTEVSGNYAYNSMEEGCGTSISGNMQIKQNGFSLRLRINDKDGAVGTIVEQHVVVNLDGTVGKVPYWTGVVNEGTIVLTDVSGKCRVVLSKK